MSPDLIISLISLLLSIIALASTFYEQLIPTKFQIRWCTYAGNQLNVCLMINNMSSRPASLTKAFLVDPDPDSCFNVESTFFPCRLMSFENDKYIAYSDYTPINIPARSTKVVIISFQYLDKHRFSKRSLMNTINLELRLNRRTVKVNSQNPRFLNYNTYSFVMEKRAKSSN